MITKSGKVSFYSKFKHDEKNHDITRKYCLVCHTSTPLLSVNEDCFISVQSKTQTNVGLYKVMKY